MVQTKLPKNWHNLYTPEINKKRSLALKGIRKSNETKERMKNAKKGKEGYWKGRKLSEETKQKIREAQYKLIKEGKHNLWKGGISFKPYSIDWTETLKRAIRERDHYLCQLCSQYGNEVHHIDYDKKNCSPDNLITLCHNCHNKTNNNRNYWKLYLEALLTWGGQIPSTEESKRSARL